MKKKKAVGKQDPGLKGKLSPLEWHWLN